MSLILRVLDAAYCQSTHHKLALDALSHLRVGQAPAWRDFLVTHHRMYFEGAKDPDKTFKDFTNHVLHVRDNYWGGAREQARHWYAATVRALWKKEWALAAYNAGVLSHYVTDPLMPFHTGQSKEESNIHRAVEWSIRQSYDELRIMAQTQMGYPNLEAGTQPGWLDELVTAGAEISNGYYEALIERFDFAVSLRDPKEGLDRTGRQMITQMIGFATISLARILDRAFVEAGVAPPSTNPTLEGIFAVLDIPIAWISKNIADARERATIEAQYREWRTTGEVDKTLSADVRQVRDRIEQVRAQALAERSPAKVNPTPPASPPAPVAALPTKPDSKPEPAKPKPAPAPCPTTSDPAAAAEVAQVVAPPGRQRLQRSDEVERAPSIGPKTAERLQACGVITIGDLLDREPASLSKQLGGGWTSASVVTDWQDQARLVMEVPHLRAEQAKILTGSGYRSASALAEAQPEELLQDVTDFLKGTQGQRAIRGEYTPSLRDMASWIGWAEQACPLANRRSGKPANVELSS